MDSTAGFFQVGDNAIAPKLEILTPKILEQKTSAIRPLKPGIGYVKISFGHLEFILQINVKSLPIKIGENVDSVIEKLGLPDYKEWVVATFPDIERVDGVSYHWDQEREFGDGALVKGPQFNVIPSSMTDNSAKHWRWLEFPTAVIIMDQRRVLSITTHRDESKVITYN